MGEAAQGEAIDKLILTHLGLPLLSCPKDLFEDIEAVRKQSPSTVVLFRAAVAIARGVKHQTGENGDRRQLTISQVC